MIAFARKIIVTILIASLLISCSASRHAGITRVVMPKGDAQTEEAWFLFYQDRFDAFKGNVEPPPANYPPMANVGFDRAKSEWSEKEQMARTNTSIVLIIMASLLLIIGIQSFHDNLSHADFSF